jgi:UDP-N-acetylglucosamine 4,6-dehydratase/5-epimerase
MLNNKSILITGGTGSFGKKFIDIILKKYKKIKRLVIFSRDELKQYELSKKYPTSKYDFIRYFIGDVRDKERLKRAIENIDYVIHAAALKQVDTAEYNPDEYIKTNIIGSNNVVEACLANGVKKVIALSTDKACSPVNLYGATKLCSEKIFLAANNIKGNRDIIFTVVRYGNVAGSRGSIIPKILEAKENREKYFYLTHEKATRFWISLEESVDMVLWTINNSKQGQLLIPKIPSFKISDLINAVYPNCKIKITGLRPGEKIHEDLVSINETNLYDIGKFYSIYPSYLSSKITLLKNNKVSDDFMMNSGTYNKNLNIKDLIKKIKLLRDI